MKTLEPRFVEFIPEQIEDGMLYITIEYRTAIHNCACGCGNRVVTPLTPTDWRLTFDGKTVSLYPSVGNWSFSCQSHYWVKKNLIEFAPKWPRWKVTEGRNNDIKEKKKYFKWRRKKKEE